MESRLLQTGASLVRVWRASDPLPFSSDYTSAQTLGSDRKMLVMGANKCFPGVNRLVVGMGSCITYDLIDAAGHHLGGDISPGLHMRWQAMHQFTARLPLVAMPAEWPTLGTDTPTALQAGVLQGVLAEIQGRKSQLELILSELTIILSGEMRIFLKSGSITAYLPSLIWRYTACMPCYKSFLDNNWVLGTLRHVGQAANYGSPLAFCLGRTAALCIGDAAGHGWRYRRMV